jgi:hypothetical protein
MKNQFSQVYRLVHVYRLLHGICGVIFGCLFGAIVSCGGSPLPDSYTVVFPGISSSGTDFLGEPRWRLEWYDPEGTVRFAELEGKSAVISVLVQWPNPVIAWPYWPEKGLSPGLFHPAGALYPFDVRDTAITLSWQGGVEASFYRELAAAQSSPGTDPKRDPRYFDWPRFRSLVREEAPEPLRSNPWLADWQNIAGKTALSGFRKSLVREESRTVMGVLIPHDGPWLGVSPFTAPAAWTAGEEVFLPLSSRPEVYVCPGGMLFLSTGARLWKAFDG